MMQFVPYNTEDQSVIRRITRNDWKQTVITMFYTTTNRSANQSAQEDYNVEVEEEHTDLAVDEHKASDVEGKAIYTMWLRYHWFLLLLTFNNKNQQIMKLRRSSISPTGRIMTKMMSPQRGITDNPT